MRATPFSFNQLKAATHARLDSRDAELVAVVAGHVLGTAAAADGVGASALTFFRDRA